MKIQKEEWASVGSDATLSQASDSVDQQQHMCSQQNDCSLPLTLQLSKQNYPWSLTKKKHIRKGSLGNIRISRTAWVKGNFVLLLKKYLLCTLASVLRIPCFSTLNGRNIILKPIEFQRKPLLFLSDDVG